MSLDHDYDPACKGCGAPHPYDCTCCEVCNKPNTIKSYNEAGGDTDETWACADCLKAGACERCCSVAAECQCGCPYCGGDPEECEPYMSTDYSCDERGMFPIGESWACHRGPVRRG